MKLFSRLRGSCFCAFCKAERKVYVKKHVDLTNVVGALLLAVIVGQAYWGAPDPRAIIIFSMTILTSEVLIYLRWRSSIICNLCGFDPIVYKRSPATAASQVRAFYAEKKENPEFWLTRSPLVERTRKERIKERKDGEYKNLTAKILARRPTSDTAPVKAAIGPAAQSYSGVKGSRSPSSLATPKSP